MFPISNGMKKFISALAVGSAAFMPFLASAQVDTTKQTIGGLGLLALNILNIVLLIILALAFLYFVLGVVRYIMAKEAKAKEEGRNNMIYGIIGLFVIFSAWGLVRILQNTIFGGANSSTGITGGTVTQCANFGPVVNCNCFGTINTADNTCCLNGISISSGVPVCNY